MSENTCDGTPSWPDPQTAELVRLRDRVESLEAKLAAAERDELQAIVERDAAEGEADTLAETIGEYLGIDIGEHSSGHNPWRYAVEMLEDRKAKLAAAERDAARYRWLREHCNEFSVRERIHPDATEWWDTLCGDGLDERLDAAMQSHDGGNEGQL